MLLSTSTLCSRNGSSLPILEKKPRRLLQSTAGVEQDILSRDFNPHTKILLCRKVLNNHVGKVMHVDDHLVNAEVTQARERDLQQRCGLRSPPAPWDDRR